MKNTFRRVLVTGGAGFVGSSLALGLRAELPELSVVVLDNLKRRGSELNVQRLRDAGCEFVHGDIRVTEDIEAVGEADLVIECSAEPSVLAGYSSSPAYLVQTNLMGTVNCLEYARKHGAGMIFLSTSRVYPIETINRLKYSEQPTRFVLESAQDITGISPDGIREDFPIAGARSLYGATKLCSELLIAEYASAYGLRAVINRCGVIAGPWQMGKVDQGVVVLWVARHIFGGALSYIGYGGTGKQVRDVLHIDDLLDLILREIYRLDDFKGMTFNAGGGLDSSASLCELTAICEKVTGKQIPIGNEPKERPGDLRWYVTDNQFVTEHTGWAPARNAQKVVEDVAVWIDANADLLRPLLG